MKIRRFILGLLGYREADEVRYYEAEAGLHEELVRRADRERRPVAEVRADALETGLAQIQTREALVQLWESLSRREQDVAAMTCWGYTNGQIAMRLGVLPVTVKTL